MITRKVDGYVCTLTGVCHVPDLRNSLISLGALTGEGARVVLERERLGVSRKGKVVMSGRKVCNLYMLQGQACLSWVEAHVKVGTDKWKELLEGTTAACSGDVLEHRLVAMGLVRCHLI